MLGVLSMLEGAYQVLESREADISSLMSKTPKKILFFKITRPITVNLFGNERMVAVSIEFFQVKLTEQIQRNQGDRRRKQFRSLWT